MPKAASKPRELGPLPQIPPNQTLYITNLPTAEPPKQTLRLLLYTLFSTYGPVLDVVALRTPKMRGKAHVVFRDVAAATQAMRALQGWVFLGLPLRINYARGKSEIISRLQGTYNEDKKVEQVEAPKTTFAAIPGSAPAGAAAEKPSEKPGEKVEGAPQGVKRPREEESDDEDEEMEMDEDD